jgi:hypothetical protein
MAVERGAESKATGKQWYAAGFTSAQTNLAIVADPGDGFAVFIDQIHFSNLSAANTVELRDGSGGTAVWRWYCAAAVGNEDVSFPVPIGISASTGLYLNTTATAGHWVAVLYHIEAIPKVAFHG